MSKRLSKIGGEALAPVQFVGNDGTFEQVSGDIVAVGGSIALDVAAKGVSKNAARLGVSIGTSLSKAAATGAPLAAAGPPGWVVQAVLLIVQVGAAIIDSLFNPFKTYFNKDLRELKNVIDLQIKKQFLKNGYNYPLEIKPNMIPETSEEMDIFNELLLKYYEDNGLISNEDVIKEEEIFSQINLLNRYRSQMINPLFTNTLLYQGTTQNITLLIAAAAAKKKGYSKELKSIKEIDYKNYKFNWYKKYVNFIEENLNIVLGVIICIICIISIISIIISIMLK